MGSSTTVKSVVLSCCWMVVDAGSVLIGLIFSGDVSDSTIATSRHCCELTAKTLTTLLGDEGDRERWLVMVCGPGLADC